MYPEVEQYLAAVKAAREALSSGLKEVGAALSAAATAAGAASHTNDWRTEACPRCAWIRTPFARMLMSHQVDLGAARNRAHESAWALLRESKRPLVRWIAENCEEYASEAELVLEMLPASLERLDALAAVQDWCPVWGRFRRAALEAGVLDDTAESEVSA